MCYNKGWRYFVMKLTVSKSKNSASFYVQKSIRKPNGSVTTVTIEKLGNLDEVRTKAGGEDPYVWAQNYVNELNRKEYEEQKSVIISYSPTKLIKKEMQNLLTVDICFCKVYTTALDLIRYAKKSHPGILSNTT